MFKTVICNEMYIFFSFIFVLASAGEATSKNQFAGKRTNWTYIFCHEKNKGSIPVFFRDHVVLNDSQFTFLWGLNTHFEYRTSFGREARDLLHAFIPLYSV